MADREVDYVELAGAHLLSGVDSSSIPDGYGDTADCINFVLDDKTYSAMENPSDGYRSYLGYLVQTEALSVLNTFPPIAVRIEATAEGGYWEGLRFYDVANEALVLEIGTSSADDYYPSCVMSWNPSALAINAAAAA